MATTTAHIFLEMFTQLKFKTFFLKTCFFIRNQVEYLEKNPEKFTIKM